MKILHIGPSEVPVLSSHGGAVQRRIVGLARIQAADGHEVTVMSPSAAGEAAGEESDWRRVDVALRTKRPLRDYEFLMQSRRALAGERFDVLHAHGVPDAHRWLGGLAGVAVQTVDFYRYRLTDKQWGHRYYTKSLNRYARIMPVSQFCRDGLTAYYPALTTPLEVVPNGVDPSQFDSNPAAADAARSALALPRDRRLVVYLGRVCHQKGSDLLKPLAERLRLSHPDTVVVAAGPPEQFSAETGARSTLMDDLAGAGVVVTGAVHEDYLAGLLAAADVVVLPTRADEMFGMAALEALSCGTPVVASDLGGIPEAVGSAGVVFQAEDGSAFHRSVGEVLDGQAAGQDWTARARAHALRFSWGEVARRTHDVYAASLELS